MKKTNILIIVLILLGALVFFVFDMYNLKSQYHELDNEYSKLLISDSLSSKVISTYYPSNWRGGDLFQYVTLSDKKKIQISIRESITSQTIVFGSIVKPECFIKKKANSDSLYIMEGGETYIFLIDEDY